MPAAISWRRSRLSKNRKRDRHQSIQLVRLHDGAADGTVVPQHAGIVEVKTVVRVKIARILRERAVAPKVNVGQAAEKVSQETIGLVHMRVEVRLPLGKEQARNDATHENVFDAGNARYAKGEIDDGPRGGFGRRSRATEIVCPDVKDHGVWGQLPDQIELRRCRKDIAWLVFMPDIEHEGENCGFLERKVVPSGIARNKMIQAADIAVAQHENDGRFVFEVDGVVGRCARNRHD